MNIIGNRKIYFIISGISFVIAVIAILFFGLKLSIEFTGGSRIGMTIEDVEKAVLEDSVRAQGIKEYRIDVKESDVMVRTSAINQDAKNKIVAEVKKTYPKLTENSFETVGPTIGGETQLNALKAVVVASVAITLYIAFAFRKVSKEVASWKYGLTAVIALIHDVIITIGAFAIFGHFLGVEIDSLFITAMLTVMGFSVHDTIVVFDRVRENLRKNLDLKFEVVVNNALLETLNRSLNTSITVAIVLVSLILFGGESIRWFVAALLIGVIVGTYSSIFTATPLLVVWYELGKRRKEKKAEGKLT